MPEDMPEDMSEYMPEDMSDRMPEDMSEYMPEDMPDRVPEDMSDRVPEDMPDRMSNRMSEDMSDRMPEDLPVRKCINVMVGITRSKVILSGRFLPKSPEKSISGWWFGTWILFSPIVGMMIQSDQFFSGWNHQLDMLGGNYP